MFKKLQPKIWVIGKFMNQDIFRSYVTSYTSFGFAGKDMPRNNRPTILINFNERYQLIKRCFIFFCD